MKVLPSILYCIISFGFGFIFGYFVSGYPIFVDILKLIVGGIVAGLTIQAIQTYKEIKEKRLIHSKVLLDNNLKYRTKTDICFENDNILNLEVKTKYSLGKQDEALELSLPLSDRRYSKEVDAHLESGYSEVWKHRKERDSLINDHNAFAKDFLSDIVEVMRKEFENSKNPLSEWDINTKSHENYFIRDKLLINLCYIFQYYYNRKTNDPSFDFNRLIVTPVENEKNRWKLSITQAFAYSNNKDMQDIKSIFRKVIIDDCLRKPDFNKLIIYRNEIKEKHDLYINGIDERIMEVENGFPLKGHCKFCPSIPI